MCNENIITCKQQFSIVLFVVVVVDGSGDEELFAELNWPDDWRSGYVALSVSRCRENCVFCCFY
jgi:hypothetical protein